MQLPHLQGPGMPDRESAPQAPTEACPPNGPVPYPTTLIGGEEIEYRQNG